MTAVVTNKTRIFNAKNFIESFSERSPDNAYLYFGKNSEWVPDDLQPDEAKFSPKAEREIFKNILGLKKLQSANIAFAIKRVDWESGTIYDPYDDEEEDIVNRPNKLYVLNEFGNVFKCIDRPEGVASTIQPTSTNPIDLEEPGDGYKWKFMFGLNLYEAQNLLTRDFIPVKKLYADDGSAQWGVQQAAIDGTVNRVKIDNKGNGDYNSATVVVISGDGVGFSATANIGIDNNIESITVDDEGSGYSFIELEIQGDGTGAEIRGIIAPEGGHGSDVVNELNAIYALVRVKLDESEGGVIPTDVAFRQIGILVNPLTNVTGTLITVTNENGDFNVGNLVEGGSSGATGEVVYWDYSTQRMWLKNAGAFSPSESIAVSGGTSAVIADINTNVNLPATNLVYDGSDILEGFGDLVYIENRIRIQRNDAQSEDIRLIVEF